jgi:hypothetical protein
MKLTFGERQPYRIWFDYLKTCLNDNVLSKKVDREHYKSWHLNLIKTQTFDTWYKSHEHLFVDVNTQMKISTGTKNPNSVLVEIPVNYSITKAKREIGKILENKLNQSLSKFRITSNRPLILPPLDYFLYAWKLKNNKKKLTLEEIWEEVNLFIRQRQSKVKKQVAKGKLRQRFLMGTPMNKEARNKSILISRNITKAQRILENVCRGIFAGNYSDR